LIKKPYNIKEFDFKTINEHKKIKLYNNDT